MIASRNNEEADKVVNELSGKGWHVTAVRTDVSVESDVKRMVKETLNTFGHVDILVNNAGIYPSMPVSKTTLDDFEKVLAIN